VQISYNRASDLIELIRTAYIPGSYPKYNGCGECECRKVQFGASVVAGCDASPVLDFAKHALDTVAAFVALLIIFDGHLA
jgi:hypothetical protein